MAKQMAEILGGALRRIMSTETTEPTTMATPQSIEKLALFLGVKTFNDPQLMEMLNKIGQWLKRIEGGATPCALSLLGNSETGKTHCATRVAKWLHSRPEWDPTHFLPFVIYWPKLIDQMRDGEFQLFRDLQSWPFLVVDDIFAERDPSGFAADRLNTLLGARGRHWTLLTGNITFDRIAEIDERIASRLVRNGGLVVECLAQPFSTR